MIRGLRADGPKMARYATNFLRRRVIHTNLQLLYNCNFRCQICDFWKKENRRRPQLSLDQVRVISQKLDAIGPQIVSIGGGEPLLHKQLEDIVATLAERHFPVMICNGWFMTPEKAKALFAAGMYEISVSVDYVDPSKHDAQRGVEGAHERAVEALRILHENRTSPWQRVHMISVVMEDNLRDVEGLIQLSEKLGITYLVTLYSRNRGERGPWAHSAEISRELLRLKDKYPRFVQLQGYIGRFSEAVEKGGIGPCYAGKNLLNIDSAGHVTTCIDKLEDPVGNILTDDMAELERKLLQRHHANSCNNCWTSCRGAIETLMYGRNPVRNLIDYAQMTRPIGLN